VNPLELRTAIRGFLNGVSRPRRVFGRAELVPPIPGEPLAIEVEVDDPFASAQATRRYRITIEEITEES